MLMVLQVDDNKRDQQQHVRALSIPLFPSSLLNNTMVLVAIFPNI